MSGTIDAALNQLQSSASEITGLVVGSVGTVVSGLVTALLSVLLLFHFLKDGPVSGLGWVSSCPAGRQCMSRS